MGSIGGELGGFFLVLSCCGLEGGTGWGGFDWVRGIEEGGMGVMLGVECIS